MPGKTVISVINTDSTSRSASSAKKFVAKKSFLLEQTRWAGGDAHVRGRRHMLDLSWPSSNSVAFNCATNHSEYYTVPVRIRVADPRVLRRSKHGCWHSVCPLHSPAPHSLLTDAFSLAVCRRTLSLPTLSPPPPQLPNLHIWATSCTQRSRPKRST